MRALPKRGCVYGCYIFGRHIPSPCSHNAHGMPPGTSLQPNTAISRRQVGVERRYEALGGDAMLRAEVTAIRHRMHAASVPRIQ